MRPAMPPLKNWKLSLTSSVLLAGHGAIAVPLQRMAGDGFFMRIKAAGRRYIVESGQPGRAGQQRLAINVDHGPNCFLILCARKASLLKTFHAQS
jgi:hypothetical protein